MEHPFNDDELLTIFEFARIAMADGDTFDDVVDSMDVSDGEMVSLREKLNDFMC